MLYCLVHKINNIHRENETQLQTPSETTAHRHNTSYNHVEYQDSPHVSMTTQCNGQRRVSSKAETYLADTIYQICPAPIKGKNQLRSKQIVSSLF